MGETKASRGPLPCGNVRYPMDKDKLRNFPPINPAAAILLDEVTFTIKYNTRTGQIGMTTTRPDFPFLAVIKLLLVQSVGIIDGALEQAARGAPGFVPPGGEIPPGRNPGGNPGDNGGAA